MGAVYNEFTDMITTGHSCCKEDAEYKQTLRNRLESANMVLNTNYDDGLVRACVDIVMSGGTLNTRHIYKGTLEKVQRVLTYTRSTS